MWQNVQRMDYPKSEDIDVVVDTAEVLAHKFTIVIGKDVSARQVLALTEEEAVTLHAKLGFSIEEYYRRTEDGEQNKREV